MRKKSIKILSLMCLIITLASGCMPTIVYATRGTFTVDNISTYILTTKNNEEWGICGKQLYDSTTGKWKTAFCIELRKRIIHRR